MIPLLPARDVGKAVRIDGKSARSATSGGNSEGPAGASFSLYSVLTSNTFSSVIVSPWGPGATLIWSL